jgi:hypothetical protein
MSFARAGRVRRSSRRAKVKTIVPAIRIGRILLRFAGLVLIMKIKAEIIKLQKIPTPPKRGMFPE